jgi:hypothetical protein
MKVLVACEFSGIVRDAFIAKGNNAVSCDLLPSEREGDHIQDDVLNHLDEGWDMMVAHPPCTYLSCVGNRWMNDERRIKQKEAFDFFMVFVNSNIPKWCIENPVGYVNTHYRKPDQTIHPFHFGDDDKKRTCLWLRGLPELLWNKNGRFEDSRKEPEPLYICQGEKCKGKKIYRTEGLRGCGSKENRAKERARTFPGIANAMAEQWSKS